MTKLVADFKEKLNRSKLPGYEAHKKMLPKGRVYTKKSVNYKESAVNLILFFESNKLKFILTKRAENMSHHSGQISLPGGAKDKTDKNLWETAKRETFEEIGINVAYTNLIGKLSELIVPVSGYIVQPYVTFLEAIDDFNVNLTEVAKVFKVDFDTFFDKNNIFYQKKLFGNIEIEYPYYKLENEEVWGLTAMILSEFNELIKQ